MPLRRDLTENGGGFDTPDLVSNGAYHVSAWTKSSELTAARNDEYYEARLVGPDELHFIFTANADEAWQLYEAGEIDYIAHLPDSVIAELSQDESWKPTAVYATASILYNNESDTFSNEHIRKAFDLAIDRAAATAAHGEQPRNGPCPLRHSRFRRDGGRFPHDGRRALRHR
jgi:oligopeptide transport system substrate-binding protein